VTWLFLSSRFGRFLSVLVKMKWIGTVFLLFFVQQVVLGTHDVYIVTMEGDPVVSYRGGVEGFPATAMDLDDDMDVARY
jgi:hypothetical protein